MEKSNLFQWELGTDRITGLINKGRIGIRNNQSDQLIGNLTMEQNIRNKETGRRIEENNGLPTIEHTAKIPAFYNERSEQGIGNMEVERLGMSDGHQISAQSCSSNRRIREVPSVYIQGNPLYASGNAIRDLDSTEDLREDNINNNRQSEKQEPSANSKLCRRHSVSDVGSKIIRQGDGVDSRGVQEIWMGDQREEEQAEAGVTEGIEGASSKTDKANNGRKSTKDQKRGKFGWQAQVFHSIIQTRRIASIANKQINEQSSENNGLDKRNDSNEEVFNRAILVGDIVRQQQTKDDRQETERDNNIDGCINNWMGGECNQEQHKDQENIRIMGSEYGELQPERDSGDLQINISPQGIYQPIGIQLSNDRNRQYNSVFLNSKSKSKVSFEERDRFDFINRRGKWMDINNKTYRWDIEQRSGRVIKVVDGRGLFNKERGVGQSSERLVSGNNSGSICSKKQCQTQEILYIRQGQEGGRMRFNENLLGGGICINTPTDTNNRQSNKENSRGESIGNNDSTPLARIALVDAVKGDSSERKRDRREREGIGDGIEDEEEESESSSGEDVGFRGKRGQDGARLFRSALEASGLSKNAIRSIIDNWHGSWRRHACALSAFWEYLRRKGMIIEQLARLEKPYIIIAEYITNLIKHQSDAFVIQARTSVSTMFELMGREEKEIRNKVIEQLMLKPVANTRKVIREVTIWKMEQLLDYIVNLKLQRSMLNISQVEQGIIIICMNLLKGKRGRVEVTLKVVENKAVCLITWFQAWNEKRKTKTTDKDLLWRNNENKRALTPEECSKEIEIDRWSRHSESADTVRENYDVNNNDSIRKALSECVSTREEVGVSELRE
ncbi:MAG: hypothetical protein EZS28_030750 [Streblomastix strix]|uniref:Uncharacterized protein n=1 Tax=Streblomastix strix TaxID=222440 RepID=A0A5J4UTT1_9EUKA|nr:MAG: hypothetical protein EZS28_030750 [Streblomastix strix]